MHFPNEFNHKIIRKLPSIESLIEKYPLTDLNRTQISMHRQEIQNILIGKDPRLLVIVGPCSAWPDTAVLTYATKLVCLNEQLKHSLKIVMRVYIQKPRTICGWGGPLYQPDPYARPDILKGMEYTRKMMMNIINLNLPIADEALYIENYRGFLELLSWVAIGARSTENSAHRIFASGINVPVGMKNPTHGHLKIAINSIKAAQTSHITCMNNYEMVTAGNPFAHLVLRGSHEGPNYSLTHLEILNAYFEQQQILNPAIIIDVSHDNTLRENKKNHALQSNNIFEIMDLFKKHHKLKKLIKGFMIESFIKSGAQSLSTSLSSLDHEGLSITDACLSWEETEHILFHLSNKLK